MLAASFKKVLLFDADALPLQPLHTFFEHPGFLEHGALFFLDRLWNARGDFYKKWFPTILPEVSDRVRETAMYKGSSRYHMEAGAVLINKEKNLNLRGCI